jgi:hypothetical protein
MRSSNKFMSHQIKSIDLYNFQIEFFCQKLVALNTQ